MSDIFESDITTDIEGDIDTIQKAQEALNQLEDTDTDEQDVPAFLGPLYKLKLEYSKENLFLPVNKTQNLKAGDIVMVPTRYGPDLAKVLGVCNHPFGVRRFDIVDIIRVATQKDLDSAKDLEAKEKQAQEVFVARVKTRALDMKLITTHFLPDGQKALFFFSADNRIDFRDLVKDLVSVFKVRIELRQINTRDETRITGGMGVCGRPFCCHCVSDKMKPASIRMAKEQNFSVNANKISGQCGRLLCCLGYEADWYTQERKNLPFEGLHLMFEGENFRVQEVNPLTATVKMISSEDRIVELKACMFEKLNGRWKIKDQPPQEI